MKNIYQTTSAMVYDTSQRAKTETKTSKYKI